MQISRVKLPYISLFMNLLNAEQKVAFNSRMRAEIYEQPDVDSRSIPSLYTLTVYEFMSEECKIVQINS